MEFDYKQMLEKARKAMPSTVFEKERFEIPKVVGHIEGNKTIISNFLQICDKLARQPEHIVKFVLKELATPGDMRKSMLVLGSKVPASRINDRIRKYADTFVLCVECGKPDTKIIKEGVISYLKCMACGAKNPVKA